MFKRFLRQSKGEEAKAKGSLRSAKQQSKDEIMTVAMTQIIRVGQQSPMSLLANDPMLLREFFASFVSRSNSLDPGCAGKRCKVGADEMSVVIEGTGTVLAREGYSSGVHRWDFTCRSLGHYSWFGVAEKPVDLEQWLANDPNGFGIPGCYTVTGNHSAYHSLNAYDRVPFFTNGQVVTFVLDCDGASLEFIIDGQKQCNVTWQGRLKGRTLFPAFATYSDTADVTVTFFD